MRYPTIGGLHVLLVIPVFCFVGCNFSSEVDKGLAALEQMEGVVMDLSHQWLNKTAEFEKQGSELRADLAGAQEKFSKSIDGQFRVAGDRIVAGFSRSVVRSNGQYALDRIKAELSSLLDAIRQSRADLKAGRIEPSDCMENVASIYLKKAAPMLPARVDSATPSFISGQLQTLEYSGVSLSAEDIRVFLVNKKDEMEEVTSYNATGEHLVVVLPRISETHKYIALKQGDKMLSSVPIELPEPAYIPPKISSSGVIVVGSRPLFIRTKFCWPREGAETSITIVGDHGPIVHGNSHFVNQDGFAVELKEGEQFSVDVRFKDSPFVGNWRTLQLRAVTLESDFAVWELFDDRVPFATWKQAVITLSEVP